MSRALAAALAVACAAAGCLGGASGDLTARQAWVKAQAAARGWHPDAALVGVAGAEAPVGAPELANASQQFFFPALPDRAPGDGRAPQWFFEYISGAAGSSLAVAAYANGTVLTDAQPAPASAHQPPVETGNWTVDSPRALQVAEQDANFSAAVAATHVLYYQLSQEAGSEAPNDPTWLVAAGGRDRGAQSVVLVDARTGEPTSLGASPAPG